MPLKFNLKNLERVAITINYTSAPDAYRSHGLTYHLLYHEGSNQCPPNFEKAFRENHWYNISGIDVYDEHQHERHRHHGNSITDGKCSTDNAQNRWPT